MARELAGFNPDSWRVAVFLGPHLYQVADAVIEASYRRALFHTKRCRSDIEQVLKEKNLFILR